MSKYWSRTTLFMDGHNGMRSQSFEILYGPDPETAKVTGMGYISSKASNTHPWVREYSYGGQTFDSWPKCLMAWVKAGQPTFGRGIIDHRS